jgi:hypothetical protein
MNTYQAIATSIALIIGVSVASAPEEVFSEPRIRVNVSGETLAEIFGRLGRQYGYSISYTPGLGDLHGPEMLYVAPTPATRAFEIVAAAYGTCAMVYDENKVVSVRTCDAAARLRDMIAFGVVARKVKIEDPATSSTVGAEVIAIHDERTAAHKAGIREGDVILNYNGKPISGTNELNQFVRCTQPGEKVAVEILRGSERISFNVQF